MQLAEPCDLLNLAKLTTKRVTPRDNAQTHTWRPGTPTRLTPALTHTVTLSCCRAGTRGIDYLFGVILAVVVANWVAHYLHAEGVYESELERIGNVYMLRDEPPPPAHAHRGGHHGDRRVQLQVRVAATWCQGLSQV